MTNNIDNSYLDFIQDLKKMVHEKILYRYKNSLNLQQLVGEISW